MRIPHVYCVFVAVEDYETVQHVVARFGLNEEDAMAHSPTYFFEPERDALSWEAFIALCAQQFLDLEFKEPW